MKTHMEYLRTPDERFNDLPGYPFNPNYLEVNDTEGGTLRMHYLDEGPKDGPIVLMLHGEPSWSFLYRKMITPVANAGFRVIAPDLIGFGKSDKPAQRADYTYQRHLNWVSECISKLELSDITLFCQDWGGLLGLRIVAEQSEKFVRVVAANTFLPTGDEPVSDAFANWKAFSQEVPVFPTSGIIKGATTTQLAPEVIAAYDAPYPDETYKAGARQFPTLVPTDPDNIESAANRAAWEKLRAFDKPFLTAFSDSDPVTAGGDKVMQKLIPGCKGQDHTTIVNGGHFLQEDQGEKLAEVILKFIADNPL